MRIAINRRFNVSDGFMKIFLTTNITIVGQGFFYKYCMNEIGI